MSRLTIPNTFVATEEVTSEPLNADFAAVKAAVDLSVGTEVTTVQTLSGPLVGEIRDDGGAVVNLLARGIVLDDSTDNRSALQAEVSRAVAAPRYLPAGVMRLPVSATAESSYFGNQSTLAVHTAVKIATSGFTLEGPGVIRPWGYASAPTSGIVMPVFMTDKNTTLGALKNLTFRDLGFEADGGVSPNASPGVNRRAFYLCGIEGLRMLDLFVQNSTGSRNLYFAHLHNNRGIQIRGLRFKDCTAGINFRYCRGIVLEDVVYDNFSEAFDFDGVNWDVVANNLTFRGTNDRSTQVLDLNSVVNAVFSNITVYQAGVICTINFKDTTPATYADYLAGDGTTPATVMTPSSRVTVRGVKAEGAGGAYTVGGVTQVMPSALIGNDWAGLPHPGFGPVQDIKLIDWDVRDCGYLGVSEGRRILLEDVRLSEVVSPSGYYAIDCKSQYATSDQVTYSDLDITLRNVSVDTCNRGGVRISSPSRAVIEGLRTANTNSAATTDVDLRFQYLEARGAQVSVDGLDVAGDVVISGLSTSGLPYSIVWGARNHIAGSLSFTGDAHELIHGRTVSAAIGDVAATGTFSRTLYCAGRRCRIARMQMVVAAAVAASTTNYRSFTIRKYVAGVAATAIASPHTKLGMAAWTPVSAGFAPDEADASLEVGDVLVMTFNSVGTGAALTGLDVTFEVIDY